MLKWTTTHQKIIKFSDKTYLTKNFKNQSFFLHKSIFFNSLYRNFDINRVSLILILCSNEKKVIKKFIFFGKEGGELNLKKE